MNTIRLKYLAPFLGMALSLAATTKEAQAGLVLEQMVEGTEPPCRTVMRIQDGRMRTDLDAEICTIANMQTREVMTVVHPAKRVMVMAAPDENPSSAKDGDTPRPKYTVTQVHEKVDGHDCQVVLMEVGDVCTTFWVARQHPELEKINAELFKLRPANDTTRVPEMLNGLILKTTTISPDYMSVTTLKSVKFEEIPDSVFQAPEGYEMIQAGVN